MNAWPLPDGRLLAAEHAYRQDVLRGATAPLPDVVGAVGHLLRTGRRTVTALRRPTTGARRTRVPSPRATRLVLTGRSGRSTLPPGDVTLGDSAVCR